MLHLQQGFAGFQSRPALLILNIMGNIKLKPFALVVIGVLLGSTITLTLTRPSVSTAEILACTNKKSGKTRLTISGKCNIESESQLPVIDLWGLQPTTSISTQPKNLKKHVVDANGKDLGELISNDGLRSFWVKTSTGVFELTSEGWVRGELAPTDPPSFSDSNCSLPYLYYDEGNNQDLELARAALDPKNPNGSKSMSGFKVNGSPISTPKSMWLYNTPSNAKRMRQQQESSDTTIVNQGWLKSGCIKVTLEEIKDWPEGGFPKKVYRTTAVKVPSWAGALSIVEK